MQQRGFTITELMIVVAIMGTLTVAVAPSLARWSTSIHMSSSIREIASELQLARSSFTFNSKGRAGAGNIAFTRLPIPTSKPPQPDKKIKVDSVGRVRICAPAADSTCL